MDYSERLRQALVWEAFKLLEHGKLCCVVAEAAMVVLDMYRDNG